MRGRRRRQGGAHAPASHTPACTLASAPSTSAWCHNRLPTTVSCRAGPSNRVHLPAACKPPPPPMSTPCCTSQLFLHWLTVAVCRCRQTVCQTPLWAKNMPTSVPSHHRELFSALDRCEEILSRQRYIAGNELTEADVRLYM